MSDTDLDEPMMFEPASNTPEAFDGEAAWNDYFYKIVRRVSDLYVGYRQRYAVMAPNGATFIPKDKVTGNYFQIVDKTIYGHLNRKYALSVFAGQHASRFMCFDVDQGGLDTVRLILNTMYDLGFPKECMAVSTSGGKGYHVELFFKNYAYLDRIRLLYIYVVQYLGLDPKKVECVPTTGHAIKLPLSKNFKTGNPCWYLDIDTFEPIPSWDGILRIQQMDEKDFVEIVKNLPRIAHPLTAPNRLIPPEEPQLEKKEVSIEEVSSSGMQLTEPGHCFLTMRSIAIHERNSGKVDEAELHEYLTNWVSQQNPAFITDSEATVRKQIDGLVAWVFSPSFHTKQMEKKETVLTSQDIALCLGQKSKMARLIMFILVCYAKRCGKARISYVTIAARAGCKVNRVVTATDEMEKNGLLKIHKGKRVPSQGFKKPVNVYYPVYEKGDISLFEFKAESYILPEIFDTDDEKWFVNLYYKMLVEMVEHKSLVSLLTNSEMKIIKEITQND